MRSIEINYTDAQGNTYKKVAENDKTFFLVPFKNIAGGGRQYDYGNIKAYDKEEPEYPLELIEDYSS